jgi:hypothetical protein
MAAKAKKPTAPGLTVVPPASPTKPAAAAAAAMPGFPAAFASAFPAAFPAGFPAAFPALPPGLDYDGLASFGRENIEAAVKANAALSAGIEAIGQEVMACARTALQSATETARGLLGAKTFEDVVRLQTDFAQRHFDGLMAESVKLSELGCSLATGALAPWEGRVEAVMAQFAPPEAKSAA